MTGCSSLKEITLPEKLEQIYEGALACGNLTYLKIPTAVKYIHPNFCLGRNNLNEIDTSENENYKFENGFLLTSDNKTICYISPNKLRASSVFTIPEGVERYSYTTNSYTNIKKLILPASLKIIGGWLCLPSSIEEVEVVEGNQTLIADNENKILYNNDNNLILCYSKQENITIKEGILGVASEALGTATNAKEITFPNSLKVMGGRSLSRINKGVNIIFGKNVNNIAGDVIDYNDLAKLGNVSISSENERYTIRNNILYSKDNKILERAFCDITGEFVVEPNIEKISNSAFYGLNKMTSIVLRASLKEIGSLAFWTCRLTKIEIPSSVNTIGKGCFNDCSNLSEIIINKKENSIQGAPWGCPYGLRAVKWK